MARFDYSINTGGGVYLGISGYDLKSIRQKVYQLMKAKGYWYLIVQRNLQNYLLFSHLDGEIFMEYMDGNVLKDESAIYKLSPSGNVTQVRPGYGPRKPAKKKVSAPFGL